MTARDLESPQDCEHEATFSHGVATCGLCGRTLNSSVNRRGSALSQMERATILGHRYGVRTPLVLGLLNWTETAREPGGFLMAVLRNDLKEACGRADADSLRSIGGIVTLLYNKFPSECWGSRDKADNWKGGVMVTPDGMEPLVAMRLADALDDSTDAAEPRKETADGEDGR